MLRSPALIALIGILLMAGRIEAQTPEAADPDVAHCAEVSALQLLARGYGGRGVAEVAADPAHASIDRWEGRFSRQNAKRVATMIRVPLLASYRDETRSPSSLTLEARCGFTSGKLLATEVRLPAN